MSGHARVPSDPSWVLNDAQREVVETLHGPVVVFATAGSGKTNSMEYRVRHLVLSGTAQPRDVMAITFTNKATHELKTRIQRGLGPEAGGAVWISTFHAAAARLMRFVPERIGMQPRFGIYDTQEQMSLIRRVMRECRIDEKAIEPTEVRARISRAKQDVLDHVAYEAAAQDPDARRVALLWARYQQRLHEANALDFDDLLCAMVHLVEDDVEIRDRLRARFKFLMVDEFQDTNGAQYRMMKGLVGPAHNVCVVGDDDQCHPPGVMIDTEEGPRTIRDLWADQEGRRVTVRAWDRDTRTMVPRRAARLGARAYDGPLVTLRVADREVPMTPDHRLLVRWRDVGPTTHATYLLWLEGRGYALGHCGLTEGVPDVVRHATTTDLRCLWLLSLHDDAWSAIDAADHDAERHALPLHDLHLRLASDPVATRYGAVRRDPDLAWEGQAESARRGAGVLRDHHLNERCPFWPPPGHGANQRPMPPGLFWVYAANAMPGHMALPRPGGTDVWAPVQHRVTRPYAGLLYSLDVAEDHTYAANGVVVGNCVYRFRGADPANLARLHADYPEVRVLTLGQNYRCSGNVVAAARALVEPLSDRTPKRIYTENAPGTKVTLYTAFDERDEANMVADRIASALAVGVPPSEIAVLYRVNAQSRAVEQVLRARRVPYVVRGGFRFYARHEVRDMLAYLRLAQGDSAHADEGSLLRVMNVPSRGIGDTTIDRLEFQAQRVGRPLWVVLRDRNYPNDVGPSIRARLASYVALVERLQAYARSVREDPALVLAEILKVTAYLEWTKLRAEGPDDVREENLMALAQEVAGLRRDQPALTITEYLTHVALAEEDQSEPDEVRERVQLGSAHSAKGLQYACVALLGMEEEMFPYRSSRAVWNDARIEEERRLAYVAVTRAKKHLWCYHAVSRTTWGRMVQRPVSRFCEEMLATGAMVRAR